MAATTTSNLSGILARTYTTDNWWVPFERNATVFLDQIEDFAQNDEPLGAARYFRLWFADPQASGSIAEGAQYPDPEQPDVEQGSVNAVEVAATFSITELMLEQAQGNGVLDTDIVHAHVLAATRNLFSDINRWTVAGHTTARLAVVESSTVTSTTFVCRNPEHVVQLRPGMKIGFYDTDTSGSLQGAVETIQSIAFSTRTVTIGNARTLTAGWGVYKAVSSTATTYGNGIQGARGVADNAPLQASIYGLARSSEPRLNGQVFTAGNGTETYSEKLLREMCHRLYHEVGVEDESMQFWMNTGVLSEHYNYTTPDRVFNQGVSGPVPTYDVGEQDKPGFHYRGKKIPFMVDGDIPAREIMLLTVGMFRRHILRRASWVGDDTGVGGSSAPVLLQVPGTDNYKSAKVAMQSWMGNIVHLFPAATARRTGIADQELAGDTVDE